MATRGVSTHKIAVSVFPQQPMDEGCRKTICEYHEYVEHVVGEYVLECSQNCLDRQNISVRIGEHGAWRDFSICDHHADIIEKRLSVEDGAVVGAEEKEPELANA